MLSLLDGKPLKVQHTLGQNKNKQQYLNRKIEKTQRYKQLNKKFILAWALKLDFFRCSIVVNNSTTI